jgi:hypothetical protein
LDDYNLNVIVVSKMAIGIDAISKKWIKLYRELKAKRDETGHNISKILHPKYKVFISLACL